MKALHKFSWHILPHPWPHCSATKTKALNHLVSSQPFIALVLRPWHTTLVNTKCLRTLQAILPSINIKCLWTQNMFSPAYWCHMQIFHIYDLPHSDTVPVKGTINDKYNIIIQCQISLLFFFPFFYSNYNAIALPSILKVTMTLPSPCPASFRSCPCQRKQSMTY